MEPDEVIDCVECGGRCHLLQPIDPEYPPQPGDALAYRCEDCMDRFDIVFEEADGFD